MLRSESFLAPVLEEILFQPSGFGPGPGRRGLPGGRVNGLTKGGCNATPSLPPGASGTSCPRPALGPPVRHHSTPRPSSAGEADSRRKPRPAARRAPPSMAAKTEGGFGSGFVIPAATPDAFVVIGNEIMVCPDKRNPYPYP